MNDNHVYSKDYTPRENFLISLLNKIIKEYKSLLQYTRHDKPLKIVEIVNLSKVPGETTFIIQVSYKNCISRMSAAEVINANYNLDDFSDFHAEMIRQAGQGKLMEFLKLTEKEPQYKIASKLFDAKIQQHIFTIENREGVRFNSTAAELSKNKQVLSNIGIEDIYDIGHSKGAESILEEQASLLMAKK